MSETYTAENVVKTTDAAGYQVGRVPPAQRKYGVRYGAVDVTEALKLMTARKAGKLPPIDGGLDVDDPRANKTKPATRKATRRQRESDEPVRRTRPDGKAEVDELPPEVVAALRADDTQNRRTRTDFDPYASAPNPNDPNDELHEPPLGQGDEILKDDEEYDRAYDQEGQAAGQRSDLPDGASPRRAADNAYRPTGSSGRDLAGQNTDPRCKAFVEFVEGRSFATIYLTEGAITMPIIRLIDSRYSLTLVLPQDGKSVTFIPKVGSTLDVEADGKSYKCEYFGTHALIPELGFLVVAFVKVDGLAKE